MIKACYIPKDCSAQANDQVITVTITVTPPFGGHLVFSKEWP